MLKQAVIAVVAAGGMITMARGDEVLFKNGDRLTGTITSAEGGKLKINSKVGGDVTVSLSDVQTFTTDQPVQIKLKNNQVMRGAATTQPATQPSTQSSIVIDGRPIALGDMKRMNVKQE